MYRRVLRHSKKRQWTKYNDGHELKGDEKSPLKSRRPFQGKPNNVARWWKLSG